MKKYFQILFIILLATGCRGQQKTLTPALRDTTITKATAFSSLFTDSSTLETFLKKDGTEIKVADGMRNFYKSRNYQLAWFTETGMAEQPREF